MDKRVLKKLAIKISNAILVADFKHSFLQKEKRDASRKFDRKVGTTTNPVKIGTGK